MNPILLRQWANKHLKITWHPDTDRLGDVICLAVYKVNPDGQCAAVGGFSVESKDHELLTMREAVRSLVNHPPQNAYLSEFPEFETITNEARAVMASIP